MSVALYSFGDNDRHPATDTDWTVMRWFKSENSAHQVSEMAVNSCLFTLTFFVTDLSAMYMSKERLKDQHLLYIHHFMGGGCIAMSLYTGFGCIGGANMYLMSELSSIFLKLCGLFPKHEQTHPLCMASFLIFLITFTVLRIFMYPYLLHFAFVDTAMMWEHRSPARSMVMWPNMLLCVGLNALQFYWYYLIWRKLFKLVGAIINPVTEKEQGDGQIKKEK